MNSIDKSPQALFNPGEARQYFQFAPQVALQAGINSFDCRNALWLSEFCRYIYRLDYERASSVLPTGIYIEDDFSDLHTSTFAVLFKTRCEDGQFCHVLAFCGSNDLLDWKINLKAQQDDFIYPGKVHTGFLQSYSSIREDLITCLSRLEEPCFITGHSLGAALATLTCIDLAKQNIHYDCCYSFGSPRVGDEALVSGLDDRNVYRVVNNCDIVTTVPVSLGKYQYSHAGKSCFIDAHGQLMLGLSEDDILQQQKEYIPSLLEKISKDYLKERLSALASDIPSYLAEHAPINYSYRLQQVLTG